MAKITRFMIKLAESFVIRETSVFFELLRSIFAIENKTFIKAKYKSPSTQKVAHWQIVTGVKETKNALNISSFPGFLPLAQEILQNVV